MTKLIAVLLIILFSSNQASSQANEINRVEPLKLDLEFYKADDSQEVPVGWFIWTYKKEYDFVIDSGTRFSGKPSLLITPKSGMSSPKFGCLAKKIPARYTGKQIELSAYMKLEDVSDFAGLMLRIDDSGGNIMKFENLQEGKINGTRDWQLYSVRLPFPKEAQTIFIGPILGGKGKIWISDVQVEIDGKDVNDAEINPHYDPGAVTSFKNPTAPLLCQLSIIPTKRHLCLSAF